MHSVTKLAHFAAVSLFVSLIFEVVQSKTTITLKNSATESGFDFLAKNFDVFLFDADGVLWSKNSAVPGSPDFVKLIQHTKTPAGTPKQVYLLSNGMRPIKDIQKKLDQFGYSGNINIITPIGVLKDRLKLWGLENGGAAKTVFLSGSTTLKDELQEAKFTVTGATKGYDKLYHTSPEIPGNPNPADVGAVVIGMDAAFDMNMGRNALTFLAGNPNMKVFVLNKSGQKLKGTNVKVGVNSILALLHTTMPNDNRLKSVTNFSTESKLATQVKNERMKSVFLIGDSVLEGELKKVPNLNIIGGGKKPLSEFFNTAAPSKNIAAMVFSIDFDFTMTKAREMLTYLSQNPNLPVCATGADYAMPPLSADKVPAANHLKKPVFPDVGGIMAFMQAALPNHSGLKKISILGKPDQIVLTTLVDRDSKSIVNYRTLMVGDTMTTDIEFGNNFAGNKKVPGTPPARSTGITQPISTLLVGTGNDNMAKVQAERNEARVPNFFAESLGSLLSQQNKNDLNAKGRK